MSMDDRIGTDLKGPWAAMFNSMSPEQVAPIFYEQRKAVACLPWQDPTCAIEGMMSPGIPDQIRSSLMHLCPF